MATLCLQRFNVENNRGKRQTKVIMDTLDKSTIVLSKLNMYTTVFFCQESGAER